MCLYDEPECQNLVEITSSTSDKTLRVTELRDSRDTTVHQRAIVLFRADFSLNLCMLIRLLKRIIRNMTNSDFLAHTNPLFRETKVLTLDLLRSYNLGLYFIKYKIYNNDDLQRHHSYNTRFKTNLRMPEYRTRLYRNSFICTAIDVYNEIYESPIVDLGNIFTLATLKKRLKTYFLSKL